MTKKPRVLLVEDDGDWLEIYCENLKDEDYVLEKARTVQQAINLLEQHTFDAVVTDLKMLGFGDDFGGFSILQKTKDLNPGTQVVVITAYGTQDVAFRATQQGAFDYVVKPPAPDKFRMSIKRAIQASQQLLARKVTIQVTPTSDETKHIVEKQIITPARIGSESMIGNSDGMQIVFRQMSKAVDSSSSVLIWGEPGTGKRLLAKAIHANTTNNTSSRFSEIPCAKLVSYRNAIFSNLEKPNARSGTLFLHDLCLLGDEGQNVLAELLVLLRSSNIRLIASLTTGENDLAKALEKERIRQSIVLAFAQLPIFIPPLKLRKEDIPALAGHFINILIKDTVPTPNISLSSEATRLLLKHEYVNGNVRELREILQDTVRLIGGEGQILLEHIPLLHQNYSVSIGLSKQLSLSELRQLLSDYFNETELKNLCFDLGIDYEGLTGTGKSDKAREIVAYSERHGRTLELIKICQGLRPNFQS